MDPATLGILAGVGLLYWLAKRDDGDGDDGEQPATAGIVGFAPQSPAPRPSLVPSFLPTGGGSSSAPSPAPLDPPPNPSGDPAGYNTGLFVDSADTRAALRALGYAAPESNSPPPAQAVRAFQIDYNALSAERRAEGATSGFFDAVGTLSVDSVAGKNTLNAIEIVMFGPGGSDNQPPSPGRLAAYRAAKAIGF